MPQSPKSPADVLSERFATSFTKIKDQLVARAGPPPASDRVTQAKEDAMWALSDQKVNKDALAQQLMTTGLPPELLDPNNPNALDIVHAHPDMAQVLGQPTNDAELADQYARMAQYPWRWPTLKDITDPDEQTAKARMLDRRFQASHQPMQIPGLGQSSPLNAGDSGLGAPVAPPAPAGPPPSPAGAPPSAPNQQPATPMGG